DVTSIAQIAKLQIWLQQQGCTAKKLDKKAIEKLLLDAELLPPPVRRVLELRQGGAQAAVKKIDALLAQRAMVIVFGAPFAITVQPLGAGLVKGISHRISIVLPLRTKGSTPPSLQSQPATTNMCVRATSGRWRSLVNAAARPSVQPPATR